MAVRNDKKGKDKEKAAVNKKEVPPAPAQREQEIAQPKSAGDKAVKAVEEKVIDTTRGAVPFETANIPGPKMARAVMPAVAGKVLAKSKRPLLIVGSRLGDGALERAVSLSRKMSVAAVGNSSRVLVPKGVDAPYINLHALALYLCDPEWKGLDGKGGYDTIALLGLTYYYASQAISAVKNFTRIKIISIDRYYHPNADFSFGNLKDDVFLAALDEVIAQL